MCGMFLNCFRCPSHCVCVEVVDSINQPEDLSEDFDWGVKAMEYFSAAKLWEMESQCSRSNHQTHIGSLPGDLNSDPGKPNTRAAQWWQMIRLSTGTGLKNALEHGYFVIASGTVFICFNSTISSVNKNVYFSYLRHPLKRFNINFMDKFQQNYISFSPIKVTLWTFNRALSYNGFYWPNY